MISTVLVLSSSACGARYTGRKDPHRRSVHILAAPSTRSRLPGSNSLFTENRRSDRTASVVSHRTLSSPLPLSSIHPLPHILINHRIALLFQDPHSLPLGAILRGPLTAALSRHLAPPSRRPRNIDWGPANACVDMDRGCRVGGASLPT